MKCSRCGECCKETEMLLSKADVKRLEKAGHDPEAFAYSDAEGYVRLRNRKGYCFFYDKIGNHCKVYGVRPAGCRLYPVIYSEEEGVVGDDICPERNTVSRAEKKRKGVRLMRLLGRIDKEAENTSLSHKTDKQS
jgi:Fe-S-cluster containining protein